MKKIRKEFTLSTNAVVKLRQEKKRLRKIAFPQQKIWITESALVDDLILNHLGKTGESYTPTTW